MIQRISSGLCAAGAKIGCSGDFGCGDGALFENFSRALALESLERCGSRSELPVCRDRGFKSEVIVGASVLEFVVSCRKSVLEVRKGLRRFKLHVRFQSVMQQQGDYALRLVIVHNVPCQSRTAFLAGDALTDQAGQILVVVKSLLYISRRRDVRHVRVIQGVAHIRVRDDS